MHPPDYTKNNIINLMSSILKGCNAQSHYPELSKELTQEIREAANILLFIVDGLGFDEVQNLPQGSFLRRHLLQPLSTVFPSTTAAAVTTFFTGLTPQEHGVLSWTLRLQELGVIHPLPWKDRKGESLPPEKISLLSDSPTVFQQLCSLRSRVASALPQQLSRAQQQLVSAHKTSFSSHVVLPKKLLKNPYNLLFTSGAQCWGANFLWTFFRRLQKIIHSGEEKKFIHAYYGKYDDYSHHYGKDHTKSRKLLQKLDRRLEKCAGKLAGTNTLLLVTADHGQMLSGEANTFIVDDHAELQECLSAFLCGEPRAAFCYVHPEKREQFLQFFEQKKEWFEVLPSSEIIQAGYFGRGKPHPRLLQRVGDYIVFPRKNYILKQFLTSLQKKRTFHAGDHGGLSDEEMLVPLVRVRL